MNTLADVAVIGVMPHWLIPAVLGIVLIAGIVALYALVIAHRIERLQRKSRLARPLTTLPRPALDESKPTIDMFKDLPHE